MIRKTTLALIIILSSVITHAQLSKYLAPVNPAYLEYLKNIAHEGSSADSVNKQLGYIPPYTILPESNETAGSQQNLLKYATLDTLPSSYDLRKLSLLTPVENQGTGNFGGNCWAFSTMSAIESDWLKEGYGKSILSEQNMITCHGFLWGFGVGGNEYLSLGYLMRLKGPVSAGDIPYNTVDTVTFHCNYAPVVAYVPEARWVNSNVAFVKRIIMDYGAVSSNLYWDDSYYKGSPYYTYCYSGNSSPNPAFT